MKFLILFFSFLIVSNRLHSAQIDSVSVASVSYLFQFNDGNGTVASNSKGACNGTLTNGPTWVTGIHGSALNFNNSGAYVTVSLPTSGCPDIPRGAGPSTFIFILKGNKSGTNYIFSYGNDGVSGRRLLSIGTSFSINSGTSQNDYFTNRLPSDSTEWFGVAFKYDGTRETMFLVTKTTIMVQSAVHVMDTTNANNLGIGGAGSNNPTLDCNGCSIDQVLISNVDLSDGQVLFLIENFLHPRIRNAY